MTALLPTRWVFICSLNLVDFQVDAEVHQLAGEDERDQDSEEGETKVSKYSSADEG